MDYFHPQAHKKRENMFNMMKSNLKWHQEEGNI